VRGCATFAGTQQLVLSKAVARSVRLVFPILEIQVQLSLVLPLPPNHYACPPARPPDLPCLTLSRFEFPSVFSPVPTPSFALELPFSGFILCLSLHPVSAPPSAHPYFRLFHFIYCPATCCSFNSWGCGIASIPSTSSSYRSELKPSHSRLSPSSGLGQTS
jgi:hypothetical protein